MQLVGYVLYLYDLKIIVCSLNSVLYDRLQVTLDACIVILLENELWV